MPRHAKSTKVQRDSQMAAGLRAHARELGKVQAGHGLVSPEAVAASYEEHLAALKDADAKEVAWKTAIRRERKLEAGIKATHPHVQRYLEAVYGPDSTELVQYGLTPHQEAVTPVATKAAAVEKRRETRRRRGTMGKKQRRKLKAGG